MGRRGRQQPKDSFAWRVVEAMRERGQITPAQLSTKLEELDCKASGGTISRWRNGHQAPTDESILMAVATVLDVSLNWLKTGEGDVSEGGPPRRVDYSSLSPQPLDMALQQLGAVRTMLAQIEISVGAAVRGRKVTKTTARVQRDKTAQPQQPLAKPSSRKRKSG